MTIDIETIRSLAILIGCSSIVFLIIMAISCFIKGE